MWYFLHVNSFNTFSSKHLKYYMNWLDVKLKKKNKNIIRSKSWTSFIIFCILNLSYCIET